MSEQKKQILQMLAEGKIKVDEAERLLAALETNSPPAPENVPEPTAGAKKPKFLHIKVEAEGCCNGKHENVDIKIPIMLVKAGMKLGTLVPEKARSKVSSHLSEQGLNFDLSQLNSENIDMIISALAETSIDVDADNEKVRIYCS